MMVIDANVGHQWNMCVLEDTSARVWHEQNAAERKVLHQLGGRNPLQGPHSLKMRELVEAECVD